MNPMDAMKLSSRLVKFNQDHPKAYPFVQQVMTNALQVGSVIEMKVTLPDGQEYVSNIKVNQNDLDTIEILKEMKMNER
ncbi:MAG: hypothetical protein VZR00_06340 [Lachnospiraceae bacterium]|jgi:hypothetical protein|nr:hypothetical protein [Lachnospiraceae bacterium]MEE3461495.1 hypothetical protein [Lachnospiraceae bacterium]